MPQPPDPLTRHLPVRGASYLIVDAEDAEWASKMSWCITDTGYAVSRLPKGNVGHLHRLIGHIMAGRQLTRNEVVDHIDHDKTNCKRNNLRICTIQDNNKNLIKRSDSNNLYKGIKKVAGRWGSRINIDGVRIWIGTQGSPKEAAWMYDQYAVQLFGEFAHTNFDYEEVPTQH